jgi:hypothetical protein
VEGERTVQLQQEAAHEAFAVDKGRDCDLDKSGNFGEKFGYDLHIELTAC